MLVYRRPARPLRVVVSSTLGYARDHGGVDVLAQLRRAAEVRRAAQRRVADAVWLARQADDADIVGQRQALAVANNRWAALVRQAAHEGHAVAVIARAAGVTASSVYYRLRRRPLSAVSETFTTVADQQNQVRE